MEQPVLARWWPQIASILDQRFYPEWWVKEQIETGRIGLVENDTAIIGVERRDYPGGAVELHGLFACGDMPGVLQLIDQVCEQAAALGFDVAAIESKVAWSKALKSRGFTVDRTRIVKELG